ncbi:MAG: DUF4091 domain-containing protein, partial [bacterium]
KMWSEDHWEMIEKYAKLMRRGRQNCFRIVWNTIDIEKEISGKYSFDFSRAERLINMVFRLGFSRLESEMVAGRKSFHDSEYFAKGTNKKMKAIERGGYKSIGQYLRAWHSFLKKKGWLDSIIQHIADEPHEECEEEYRILSGIVRKFMPEVPLLDALQSYNLEGAVDIWVPLNRYYEKNKEKFDELKELGDQIWFYTCCGPGGNYLNRLLDMPLLRTRYLHWGNYKYNLTGYLHWGFNRYKYGEQDPFEETCRLDKEDIEVSFPAGDTHITYPGSDGPWGSVRLEAMRAGIEDYELLSLLAKKDKEKADEIVSSCMHSFKEVEEDPKFFAKNYQKLLQALC